ncbi:MAG: RING finger protein [Candidatus Odinarchaeota archaeon]
MISHRKQLNILFTLLVLLVFFFLLHIFIPNYTSQSEVTLDLGEMRLMNHHHPANYNVESVDYYTSKGAPRLYFFDQDPPLLDDNRIILSDHLSLDYGSFQHYEFSLVHGSVIDIVWDIVDSSLPYDTSPHPRPQPYYFSGTLIKSRSTFEQIISGESYDPENILVSSNAVEWVNDYDFFGESTKQITFQIEEDDHYFVFFNCSDIDAPSMTISFTIDIQSKKYDLSAAKTTKNLIKGEFHSIDISSRETLYVVTYNPSNISLATIDCKEIQSKGSKIMTAVFYLLVVTIAGITLVYRRELSTLVNEKLYGTPRKQSRKTGGTRLTTIEKLNDQPVFNETIQAATSSRPAGETRLTSTVQATGKSDKLQGELSRIASWLEQDADLPLENVSKEELLSLKEQLVEKKEHLGSLLVLIKTGTSINSSRQRSECIELLTAVESRIAVIDKRLDELSNSWFVDNKALITEVFTLVRDYGKFIEVGVLHEKLGVGRLSLKELCDFLERAEDETGIWAFDGRYVELDPDKNGLSDEKASRPACRICKKEVTDSSDIEYCPECLSTFHRSHIAEWLKIKGTCPVCKRKIKVERK